MKAKEYIARINNKEPLEDILIALFYEFQELMEKRNAKTNNAAVAIINELHQKWEAIAKATSLSEDLFILSLETIMPDIMTKIRTLKAYSKSSNVKFY